tara:strand:+ start:1407 stop:2354 length:948 start_codon:yes stop_codon:yes gene_type:complete
MKFKQLREKYRSKFPSSLVSSAVKIALDMSGNMTGAYKKIEAMKKGLSKDKLVQDALRQANESVNEGKYTAYSDLLLMKARIIDKEGPKSDKLPAVDSQIKIVMKRLGIKEEKVAILTSVYKSVKKEMDKLMKKHDAYISGTSRDGTTISSPKPMGAFIKDVQKLIGLQEKVETISEGTWQTPKNKAELRKLMNLVAKPVFATKPSDIDKYMKQMPFGDDELYDDLESLFYAKDSDGKIARPIKNLNKFPKTDLNQVAMDSLNGRWLTAKKKGNGWDITHINFDFDEVEEAMKRKSGNIRPGRRMKVDLSAGKNY